MGVLEEALLVGVLKKKKIMNLHDTLTMPLFCRLKKSILMTLFMLCCLKNDEVFDRLLNVGHYTT